MKMLAVTLFAAFMVLGTTSARSYGPRRTKGLHHMMMMKMLDGYTEEYGKCPNPIPMVSTVFGMICDEENCGEKANKCMSAMMQLDMICQQFMTCMAMKPEEHPRDREQITSSMKQMAQCMMSGVMENLNISFVPGDMKANTLAFLSATLGKSDQVTEAAKTAVMNSIENDVCVTPSEESGMMDKMEFKICVTKQCIKGMAN